MGLAYCGETYYGNEKYGTSSQYDVATILLYHINPTENRYTLYWEINKNTITAGTTGYSWELQISATPEFETYTSYDQNTALVYYNANSSKGFDVNMPGRTAGDWSIRYARVKAFKGLLTSQYSPVISINIFPEYEEETAENLLSILPDGTYNKDILKMEPEDRTTNLFNIFRMYGHELDLLKLEIEKVKLDKSLIYCRDEVLYDNFGAVLNFPKPLSMNFVQYRQILRKIYSSLQIQGTVRSIKNMVLPFTGVDPNIVNVQDELTLVTYNSSTGNDVSYLDDADPPNTVTRNTAGFGVRVYLTNPAGFTIDEITLMNALNLMAPAHVYFVLI